MSKKYNLNQQSIILTSLTVLNNTLSYITQAIIIIKSNSVNMNVLDFERNSMLYDNCI